MNEPVIPIPNQNMIESKIKYAIWIYTLIFTGHGTR